MKFTLIALLSFVVAFPAIAQAEGLQGKPIPHSLELSDQHSNKQSFDKLSGEKGLILVFYRSADWCPFCKKQLIDLQARHNEIKQTGYNLVGISYDTTQVLSRFSEKRDIKFPLLSDDGSKAIADFGLLNTDLPENHFAYGVPHPAVVIINADKTVKTVLKEDGYKNRVTIDQIINAIQ